MSALGQRQTSRAWHAVRLLHPAQRTNAEASLNVCVGPEAELGSPVAEAATQLT